MQARTVKPMALSLTVLGALARLVPHPPNFAPVGAVSLFAGARLNGWQAYLTPLVLMLITDAVLGFSRAAPFIYLSFLINVWIGRRLRSTEHAGRIAAAAVCGSVQFFLLSNFGVWAGSRYFAHTLAGLGQCYVVALPFFAPTLASDLLYSGVLFGLHALLSRTVAGAERVSVETA